MQLKTYRGKSMAEALDQVKKDLGRDAVILHTRAYRVGGVLGVGGHEEYEITASDQASSPAPKAAKSSLATELDQARVVERTSARSVGLIAATVAPAAEHAISTGFTPEVFAKTTTNPLIFPVQNSPASGKPAVQVEAKPLRTPSPTLEAVLHASGKPDLAVADSLREEVGAIKKMVGELLTTARRASIAGGLGSDMLGLAALTDPLAALCLKLQEAGVSPQVSEAIIGGVRDELSVAELRDEPVVRAAVEAKLAGQFRVTGSMGKPVQGRQLVVALVGPTGVGKTTTIAKLAATYKLRLGHSVGLVTSDTYRIAAVEQLRTYANIIGVPLQVASTPEEVRTSVKALDQCAVVLVDTAGRGPRDARRLDELSACVEAASPQETHLVLSAAAAENSLFEAAERFAQMKPDRFIITKLDESSGLGWLPTLAQRLNLPISYVTNGQEVPDDLALAHAQRLARMILDGVREGAGQA